METRIIFLAVLIILLWLILSEKGRAIIAGIGSFVVQGRGAGLERQVGE